MDNPDPDRQRLEALLDKAEIAELLRRRARAADRRDLDLALSCYHRDATEDHSGFVGPAADFVRQAPSGDADHQVKDMWHGLGPTLIELDGDSALAETYYLALVTMDVRGQLHEAMAAGRYVDRLVREDRTWLIFKRTVIFDWSRVDPSGEKFWDARGMDRTRLHFGAPAPWDMVYQESARS